jgi:hypothetical protein
MALITSIDSGWTSALVASLAVIGVQLVWRGLRGGPNGGQALLVRGGDMLSRIEGFRLTVLGMVLLGVAAAIAWNAKWLLLLALGIGFVEILESSALIAVWRRGARG